MTWFKHYVGTVDDPKFDLAAAQAESTIPNAVTLWVAAEESAAAHRGSIARFDLEVVAHRLRIALDEAKRLWEAFKRLGMVAADQLRAWTERQSAWLCSGIKRPASRARDLPPAPPSDERRREETPPIVPPVGGDPLPAYVDAAAEVEAATPAAVAAAMTEATPAAPSAAAAPGLPAGARQAEFLMPIPGGSRDRSRLGADRRRRSPHQTMVDASRRVAAALRREMELSGELSAADPGPRREMGAAGA